MFKENFVRLCNQKGEAPSYVCRQVGITPATYSLWTDTSVPRKATLMRIADYFGVTTDQLLTDDAPAVKPDLHHFAEKEKEPTVTVDPELLSLIDDMTEEELADMKRYAEFILSRKKAL